MIMTITVRSLWWPTDRSHYCTSTKQACYHHHDDDDYDYGDDDDDDDDDDDEDDDKEDTLKKWKSQDGEGKRSPVSGLLPLKNVLPHQNNQTGFIWTFLYFFADSSGFVPDFVGFVLVFFLISSRKFCIYYWFFVICYWCLLDFLLIICFLSWFLEKIN